MKNLNKKTSIKDLFLVGMFLFLTTFAFSQKQGNVWAFGNKSGANFNSGVINPITTKMPLQFMWLYTETNNPDPESINHNEGASSICDSSGKLLIYSNGEKVWNGKGKLIADSLYGNFSSTQSCIILPRPGSSNIFYVFTMPAFQDTFKHGMCYTVIDMCLDGGNGAVVSNEKNVHMLDDAGEKLVAVKHANGRDYWIVVHQFWSNKFFTFILGPTGVFDGPRSIIGRKHLDPLAPNSPNGAVGEMKASPDGKKIAVVNTNMWEYQYITDMFDFNPETGFLSNYIDLKTRTTGNGNSSQPYGCSFSPDSKMLYIGSFIDLDSTKQPCVAQYDVSSMFADSIRSSVMWILIDNYDSVLKNMYIGVAPWSLQIAPNGRIYGSGNSGYLYEMSYPNKRGQACHLHLMSSKKFGRTYTMPNILTSYKYDNAVVECITTSVKEQIAIRELVYPNPASDHFVIQTKNLEFIAYLYDMNGKFIKNFTGFNSNSFNRDGIPSGLYIIKIKTLRGESTHKLFFQ